MSITLRSPRQIDHTYYLFFLSLVVSPLLSFLSNDNESFRVRSQPLEVCIAADVLFTFPKLRHIKILDHVLGWQSNDHWLERCVRLLTD